MSTIYCGVGKIPKGKKRGTMKECAELGQIRYYGIKKIDQKLIDNAKSSGKKTSRTNLIAKRGSIKGKLYKLRKEAPYEKDEKKKKQMKKEYEKLSKELKQVKKQINSLSRSTGTKKVSRKGSKKVSRKCL